MRLFVDKVPDGLMTYIKTVALRRKIRLRAMVIEILREWAEHKVDYDGGKNG